jgi:hypothetical protein
LIKVYNINAFVSYAATLAVVDPSVSHETVAALTDVFLNIITYKLLEDQAANVYRSFNLHKIIDEHNSHTLNYTIPVNTEKDHYENLFDYID